MNLSERLTQLSEDGRRHEEETHPRFFSLDSREDTEALQQLVASGAATFVHDTLESQLGELIETRSPARKLSHEEIGDEARRHTRGDFSSYGTWVFFPWSRRLVHILPEREYEELRTSRNRNKITRAEQTKLSELVVGVAGLSVGQSTAVTLALEGIGGHFRLADFDTLSLSNMNRLRAGIHEVGLKKAYLVAREIYEINPYAKIEVFDRGITEETIDAFFSNHGTQLDLLFEECDDLKMKVQLRHEARRRKIPVLMETSDRGLFDVERFDREPNRPPFHGLVGELDPKTLSGLTTYEKVPIVLAIIGATTMSKRMAASLVDIDATLKTWPQLASAVALGGAINTDAARRVALGKFHSSGRYFVDLEQLVGDVTPKGDVQPKKPAPAIPEQSTPEKSRRTLGHGAISQAAMERLVTLASLAPSGGNCQPWRFRIDKNRIECVHDIERSRTLLDFEHRATYAAFGALAENLRLGAAVLGVGVEIRSFPDPTNPLLVCEAVLGGAVAKLSEQEATWANLLEVRVTNRRLSQRMPMEQNASDEMTRVAHEAGAILNLVTADDQLGALAEALGMGDRLRLMSRAMHRDMMGELRWSYDETIRTHDGLDLVTMELTPTDEAAMRLLADWSVMEAVREVDGGHGLAQSARKSLASASAAGLVSFPRNPGSDVRSTYFSGGTAMQRIWLTATAAGYAFQPMSALPYLAARLEDGDGRDLDDRERRELEALVTTYRSLFQVDRSNPSVEVMLFRLSKASPPTARSLRRSIDDLIVDS